MYGKCCCDAVEACSCVDIVAKFTDEQYTTINQSTAGRFDPRVFVNCLQVTCKQLTFTCQRPPWLRRPVFPLIIFDLLRNYPMV